MIELDFEAPGTIDDLIGVLNATGLVDLCVGYKGRYVGPPLDVQWTASEADLDVVAITMGDQPLFDTHSDSEALSFLYGMFYALSRGCSLTNLFGEIEVLSRAFNLGFRGRIAEMDRFQRLE